jgi:hypothetical protein
MKARMMKTRWCGVALVLVLVLAAGACKKQPASKGGPAEQADDPAEAVPALFAHIPADTPYLMAALEAMPVDYYARLKKTFLPMLEGLIAEARRDSKELDAVLGELDGKWSQAGLESLGLSTRPRFAFYGLGLQPFVARLEVKDQKLLLATVARIAAKAGAVLPPPQTTKDGRAYWRVDEGDEPTLVVALVDNQLIAAIGTPAEIDAKLGLILGSEKPAQNMADGKLIKDLMAKHKLGPHALGFADTRQIASAAIAAATGASPPACTAEIARISAKVPRLVFGGEVSPTKISSAMILELSPELVTAARGLKTEIPGLAAAIAGPSLLLIGGGLDLAKGQQLVIAAAGALKQLGTACEIGPLASGAEEAERTLASPLPEPLGQIAGGMIAAHELELDSRDPAGAMPKKIEALAVLAARDAKGLFQAATTRFPELAQLGIAPDGKLHDLPAAAVPMPFPVAAAVADDRMVLAVGERRAALAEQMLAATGGGAGPLFAMSYDYGKLIELAMRAGAQEREGLDPMQAEVVSNFMRGFSSMFGRFALSTDVDDAGIAMWSTIELR